MDPIEGLHLAARVGVDEFGNDVQPLDPAFQGLEGSAHEIGTDVNGTN